jgi:hypothetical protein
MLGKPYWRCMYRGQQALTIRHDGAVAAVHSTLHNLASQPIIDGLLRSVVQHVVELETEGALAVVMRAASVHDVGSSSILAVAFRVHNDRLRFLINVDDALCKIACWPCAHTYFDRCSMHGAASAGGSDEK